jgi:hypothetical protein
VDTSHASIHLTDFKETPVKVVDPFRRRGASIGEPKEQKVDDKPKVEPLTKSQEPSASRQVKHVDTANIASKTKPQSSSAFNWSNVDNVRDIFASLSEPQKPTEPTVNSQVADTADAWGGFEGSSQSNNSNWAEFADPVVAPTITSQSATFQTNLFSTAVSGLSTPNPVIPFTFPPLPTFATTSGTISIQQVSTNVIEPLQQIVTPETKKEPTFSSFNSIILPIELC